VGGNSTDDNLTLDQYVKKLADVVEMSMLDNAQVDEKIRAFFESAQGMSAIMDTVNRFLAQRAGNIDSNPTLGDMLSEEIDATDAHLGERITAFFKSPRGVSLLDRILGQRLVNCTPKFKGLNPEKIDKFIKIQKSIDPDFDEQAFRGSYGL
jgi:hypothetical protein